MKRENQNPERTPGSGDPDNLTAEDQAALSKYEAEGGRAEPEQEGQAEQLTKLFYKTPEMQKCPRRNRLRPGQGRPARFCRDR